MFILDVKRIYGEDFEPLSLRGPFSIIISLCKYRVAVCALAMNGLFSGPYFTVRAAKFKRVFYRRNTLEGK